ncbi:UvrD-helicase domain-containing protein [Polaribacter sp. AHE13PA]|uniref:UvrD-helicase domain-containing protein n=1 Tax=Polaribacter sp. AHE13PA TaxID=2745562 RepID=UPI001C4EE5A2|nr:UvrD-helicase domain-containing protein [Polaribacter sp. AHE13PA]QXP65779.1 UvrD-helicase domain-containing protein [Polaribacter sp. AHE13PA]
MRFEIIDKEAESNSNDLPLISEIVKDLERQKFNPDKSRVLIFAFSRKKTENSVELLKEELNNLELPYRNKVDFYHAGLSGIEREEKFENFQKGNTVILISTKAFGMGMDIKNIHYIYHLGPSSSFEDFLQEIGRAGRNKELLKDAGFSEENPISTCCFMKKDDFKSIKDRNHKNQITVSDIQDVFEIIVEYISKFKNINEFKKVPFSLPLDLYNQSTESNENQATFFRLCLYWLERFKRIELGMYSPAQYPLELTGKAFGNTTFESTEEKKIQHFLIQLEQYIVNNIIERNEIIIESQTLQKWFKIQPSEIVLYLLKAQRMGFIILKRKIALIPTKNKKIEFPKNGEFKGLSLKAVFELARAILEQSQLGNQIQVDNEYLDSQIKEVISNVFNKKDIKEMIQKGDSIDEILVELTTDFVDKRSKFALYIINSIPKIKCKTDLIVEENKLGEKVYSIYNGYEKHQDWKDYLDTFEKDTTEVIKHISYSYYNSAVKSYNILDLMIKLGINEEKELQKNISISKWLGYLKGFGGNTTTMGVECYIKNTVEIDIKDKSSEDYKVSQDFDDSNKMKELRLYSLECLSQLKPESQDQFIKKYFKSGSTSDLILLLEEEFGENHPNLQAFRAEALEREEGKLNPEQMAVYNSPLRENLQVIAGPGSGKTHTLTLRVARLIQKEKIAPEDILVLAYNRAVVVELKERLGKLFKSLGYGKLIKRLNIFTFHGFVKSILKEELDNLDFNQWTTKFLELANIQPGKIDQILGNINYVFVDEFQDITNERLQLLNYVADPNDCKICVIGDPNQSIYGYDRLKEGGSMDPSSYYQKFEEIYKPKTLTLKINYRSYPDILNSAEKLLKLNSHVFENMPILEAVRVPKKKLNYCTKINFNETKIKWPNKLLEILDEKIEEDGECYNQVAVMFRSNSEVFRAYNTLQVNEFTKFRIRIQGTKSSPCRSREFHYFLNNFNKCVNKILPFDFKENLLEEQKILIKKLPNWDVYLLNLFYCIVLEFYNEKNDINNFNELISFVEEIANKDDGHLSKIYKNHINSFYKETKKQEIVLTTLHKVKGIEFDAVLIPPSLTDLPFKNNEEELDDEELDEEKLNEILDEERRLYYVAFTRAKYRLCIIEWNREEALRNNSEYKLPDNFKSHLGVKLDEGIDKYYISWGATNANANRIHYINKNVKIGDKIEINKEFIKGKTKFKVYHDGIQIGQFAMNDKKVINKLSLFIKIKGFNVSSVEVYTYNEVKIYDEKHGTNFADSWSSISEERGYIYLVDFSGYGIGM